VFPTYGDAAGLFSRSEPEEFLAVGKRRNRQTQPQQEKKTGAMAPGSFECSSRDFSPPQAPEEQAVTQSIRQHIAPIMRRSGARTHNQRHPTT
jgi:hypothetical protein